MPYNKEYFDKYNDYLNEPIVRQQHDLMFDMFESYSESKFVLDLGCGACCEYFQYGGFYDYIGIELEKDIVEHLHRMDTDEKSVPIYNLNYRDKDFLKNLPFENKKPDTFVSLFSTELTSHHSDNKKLYENLFNSGFEYGLVSGIYYKSKKQINPVKEVGEILSWQTLGCIEDYDSNIYSTVLIQLPVPSKMFGEDVVEVWKMMRKR